MRVLDVVLVAVIVEGDDNDTGSRGVGWGGGGK